MEYAEMKESIEEVIEGCHGEFAKMSDDLFDPLLLHALAY